MVPKVVDKLILINTATHKGRITVFGNLHAVKRANIDCNTIVNR